VKQTKLKSIILENHQPVLAAATTIAPAPSQYIPTKLLLQHTNAFKKNCFYYATAEKLKITFHNFNIFQIHFSTNLVYYA